MNYDLQQGERNDLKADSKASELVLPSKREGRKKAPAKGEGWGSVGCFGMIGACSMYQKLPHPQPYAYTKAEIIHPYTHAHTKPTAITQEKSITRTGKKNSLG